ncbi:MAG: NAD-dependent epimerase/dehydratase family protein [Bacteroidetes bacterium]|nr:NAD-dependent epimerase/dehydratase family protein [Bacteroidota bacterium]
MSTILITGISGFVGSNLVAHFKNLPHYKLFGYGRKQTTCQDFVFLENGNSITLDENKVDTVVHLAGIAHDLKGNYQPEDYYTVNYEGTKSIVDQFLKSKATKFIFVSSIKAACDVSSTPALESIAPLPVTHYGKSKRKAEEYILSKEWGSKKIFILRPAMMHGPGNKGNLNLLYRFVKYGLPFPLGAFHNQRSFHGIDNFCFVIQALIEKDIDSGIYHLADNGFLSTSQLYHIIAKSLGKNSRVVHVPRKIMEGCAALVGKTSMLNKLTEDMMVSNNKISEAMGSSMPLSLEAGLIKTIRSFDGN